MMGGKRSLTSFLRRLAGASLLSLAAWQAHAAPAPWPEVPFQYFAKQFPIERVLADFAGAFGLQLDLSPLVTGRLNGNYSAETPSQFLDTLASAYGLTWYYHNGVLHVAKASESYSQTLRISAADAGVLREALQNLGIFDARFGWGEFAERGVIVLSGPPAYVAAVMKVVGDIGVGPAGGQEIRVFPLKHARVEDRVFSYRNQQVTTPGIASILRNLVGAPAGADGRSAGSSQLSTAPSPTAPLPARPGLADAGAMATLAGAGTEARSNTPGGARKPVIEADQRLNAVIVRDLPERMPAYEALIRQLDVATPLIEIEAMIMDVNTDRMDSLGINWATRAGKGIVGFGDTSQDPLSTTLTLAKGDNINKTTILSNAASFFLAQINALASNGEARILARPSVLTVDNLVAVLDLSETFYIRVTGERVANVVPVSAGTLLKVVPRLIEEGGQRMVQLVVDIEDGAVQQTRQVDSLPTVIQSNISTQAVVRDSDSLLIGGYFREAETSTEDKVPVLGDVPMLGNLFRNDKAERQRRERLFMIRPRIVENPAQAAAAAALADMVKAAAAPTVVPDAAPAVRTPDKAAGAAVARVPGNVGDAEKGADMSASLQAAERARRAEAERRALELELSPVIDPSRQPLGS